MKKNIIYLVILILALGLIACVPAHIEKESVVVNDKAGEDKNNPSPTTISKDGTDPVNVTLEGDQKNKIFLSYRSAIGYDIDYDDSFTISNKNETDSYTVDNPDPNIYPYIYLNISRFKISSDKNKTKSENADITPIYDLNGNLSGYFTNNNFEVKLSDTQNILGYIQYSPKDTVPIESVKVGKYNALHYTITSGKKWNSPVSEFYFITNKDYVYSFELHYFLEATEGYAVKMKAMLDTFRIRD